MSGWEAGEQGDLVTADEIRQAECYSISDTTAVTINGSTTDATRYLRVYTPSAERHSGTWNTGKYNLVVTDANALSVMDEYVRLEGLQIQQVNPTANFRNTVIIALFTATSDVRISHSIIRGHADASFIEYLLYTNDGACTAKVWNNIWYGVSNQGSSRVIGFETAAAGVGYIYNNTVITSASAVGIRLTNGTMASKNNLVQGGGVNFAAPSGTLTNTNCASDDATADDFGGSGNRVDQTFTFVNASADDYHLDSGDAGAKDFGVDLSADADLPFSDDIDGQTRSGSWDIGADEIVGGTSFPPRNPIHDFAHLLVR